MECKKCPEGKFQGRNDAPFLPGGCTPCGEEEATEFQNEEGATECKQCPSFFTEENPDEGVRTKINNYDHRECADSNDKCATTVQQCVCPQGYYSDWEGVVSKMTDATVPEGEAFCRKCVKDTHCLGDYHGDLGCARGYHGELCGSCVHQWQFYSRVAGERKAYEGPDEEDKDLLLFKTEVVDLESDSLLGGTPEPAYRWHPQVQANFEDDEEPEENRNNARQFYR